MKVHVTKAYMDPTPVPKMPTGLVELLEGLSREVLKKNPSEVYEFCAQHMRNLLVLRDGKQPEKYLTLEQKIVKANHIIKRRAEERRRNFDDMQLLETQESTEQSNDTEVVSKFIKPDDLGKPNSELYEDNENVSGISQDKLQNDETEINIKDGKNEVSAEPLNDKDKCDNVLNENYPIEFNEITKNFVSDASNDGLNSHVHHAKAIDEQGEILESLNQIDISGEHDIKQTSTVDKIDNPICPNVEDVHDISQNTINSDLVPTAEPCKNESVVEQETVTNKNEDQQDISNEEAEQKNVLDSNTICELNDGHNIVENIVIDTSGPQDIETYDAIENKLHGFETVNVDIDEDNNDGKNVLNTDATNTTPEIEVSVTIKEQNDVVTKDTVEGTSLKSENQTSNTDKEDNQKNNINHNLENEIISNSGDAIIENEINIQDLERTKELISQSTDQDSFEHTETVIVISEQRMHELNDGNINLSIINSDINKSNDDHKNGDSPITEAKHHEQDNKNDGNINQCNTQLIVEESNESLSNNNHENETSEIKNPKSMDLETAAITIQKVFRNFLFRSKTSSFEEPTNIEFNVFEREDDTKGVSDFKNNTDRRVMGISRMDTVLQTVNEEKSLSLSTDDSSTISSAATVIQAHVRGFLCRNRLSRNKAISNASLNESNDVSSEVDPDLIKNKHILNIHIVPEAGQFVSRDESLLTSLELSLDGSPPTSANLHPLGYDRSERRKQLKREDAIQSISPPSNNSRLSEEQDSVKEVVNNEAVIDKVEKIDTITPVDSDIKIVTSEDVSKNSLEEKFSSNVDIEENIEISAEVQDHIKEVINSNNKIEEQNVSVIVPTGLINIAVSSEGTPNKDLGEKHSPEENSEENSIENQELESAKEVLTNEDKTEVDQNINIPADSPKNIDISPKISDEILKDGNMLSEEQPPVQKELNAKIENQDSVASQKTDNSQINIPQDDIPKNNENKPVAEISSDELDVVTPFTPTEEKVNESDKPNLLHSGEFHDMVLPTKVSRNDTSVVRDFHNVLVYFLVWNNS